MDTSDTDLEHPMDRIRVRSPSFAAIGTSDESIVWSKSSPGFAVFINAYSVHVPYFERFLISAMRKALPQIEDATLEKDVESLIGQEGQHAKCFVKVNEALASRYPRVEQLKAKARAYYAKLDETGSTKETVGFAAGYETFTFLAGMTVLDNYEQWLKDADPIMRAIWVWHQIEEIEHGSVAFDVYRKLFGQCEWYRKWMVVRALAYIARETTRAYSHMVVVEGWHRRPAKALYAAGFCLQMLMRLLWNGLPVLRRGYHPRDHPRVTSNQNKIQVAWRQFEKQGGDISHLDSTKMAALMDRARRN